ncbi:hypothetical protein GGR57DRAFT_513978 [Xylariaceae sp. FL1272]|nr:hypothetical protein GGR57DRAFT_513978 [Xylariaceae sp. FL1272]
MAFGLTKKKVPGSSTDLPLPATAGDAVPLRDPPSSPATVVPTSPAYRNVSSWFTAPRTARSLPLLNASNTSSSPATRSTSPGLTPIASAWFATLHIPLKLSLLDTAFTPALPSDRGDRCDTNDEHSKMPSNTVNECRLPVSRVGRKHQLDSSIELYESDEPTTKKPRLDRATITAGQEPRHDSAQDEPPFPIARHNNAAEQATHRRAHAIGRPKPNVHMPPHEGPQPVAELQVRHHNHAEQALQASLNRGQQNWRIKVKNWLVDISRSPQDGKQNRRPMIEIEKWMDNVSGSPKDDEQDRRMKVEIWRSGVSGSGSPPYGD